MTLHVVLNPSARGIRPAALLRRLDEGLGRRNYHLCTDLSPAHLGIAATPGGAATAEAAFPAAAPPRDAIIVAGGDGTLSRVINAIGPFGPPVGILPGGTANDLASSLGIPRDVGLACAVIRSGHVRAIDLVSVNGKLFVTCGGLGLPAAVAARANRWRTSSSLSRGLSRWLGRGAYVLAAGVELARRRSFACAIACGRAVRYADAAALVVSNQASFGGLFAVSPRASNQDGLVDLWALRRPGRPAGALGVLLAALEGRADRLPGARVLRGGSAAVACEECVAFMGDGEVLLEDRRFTITVLPGALRVLAPPAPAPSAPAPSASAPSAPAPEVH